MANLNTKTKNLTDLHYDLSKYGLCPFDWTIEFSGDENAQIKNLSEKDFIFLGKIKDNDREWESLQLKSI